MTTSAFVGCAVQAKNVDTPKAEVKMSQMVTNLFVLSAATPSQAIEMALEGYTDEQFYADLEKTSTKFTALAQKAREDHKQGKTRKLR